MSFKQFSLFSAILFSTFYSTHAAAADSAIILSAVNDVGEGTFLTLVILVLILLALWILKNSNLLNDTVNINESDGSEWLKKNMKDLEADELDRLIKLGKTRKQDDHNDLK